MSVSGISGSMGGVSEEVLQQLQTARERGMDTEETAQFLVQENDGDGDGLLSLEESGLSEEMFNDVDADGDGQISAEEIQQDMQAKMEQAREMMGALNVMQGMGEGAPPMGPPPSQGSGSSSDSSSSSEQEYDELDLNEDGTVSLDELRIAFQSGVSGLNALFGSDGDESGGAASYFQSMGMEAYMKSAL